MQHNSAYQLLPLTLFSMFFSTYMHTLPPTPESQNFITHFSMYLLSPLYTLPLPHMQHLPQTAYILSNATFISA